MTRKHSDTATQDIVADVPALGPGEIAAQDNAHKDKLSDARDIAILADLEQGLSYRAIAAKYGVSTSPVSRIAAQMRVFRGAARKLMAARALEQLDVWEEANREAAKKGDHRPVRDYLLHAQEIDPLQDGGAAGSGVTIIIGNGAAPVAHPPAFPSPQVIDTQALPEKS